MPDYMPPVVGLQTKGDPRGLSQYIYQTAIKYGIDPNVALRVAKSEGLANPVGDNGQSHGAFQLYTGGGLGNDWQALHPNQNIADPANEKSTIDFALAHAAKSGWGPWHGAPKVGISDYQGIPGGDRGPQMPPGGAAAAAGGRPPVPPSGQRTPIQAALEGTPVPDQPAQQQPQAAPQQQAAASPLAPPVLGIPQMPQIPYYMRHTNPQLAYQRIPLPPGFKGFQGA